MDFFNYFNFSGVENNNHLEILEYIIVKSRASFSILVREIIFSRNITKKISSLLFVWLFSFSIYNLLDLPILVIKI